MDERQWRHYLTLLARSQSSIPCTCVGCWYEQHPAGEAFPGNQVSSTLCRKHRALLPMAVKRPQRLLPERSV
jgi:hypothetical protein